MERFNPFSKNPSVSEGSAEPFGASSLTRPTDGSTGTLGAPQSPASRQPANLATSTDLFGAEQRCHQVGSTTTPIRAHAPPTPKYTTSFPDPFGELESHEEPVRQTITAAVSATNTRDTNANSTNPNQRLSSVTFAHSVDESNTPGHAIQSVGSNRPGRSQASGFGSFLSRATSVTSSSVTDRVNEAVGSVRNAVDSISNQIQQAVPSNLNERLATTTPTTLSADQDQLEDQQQQSAASYLASKFSSATNHFTSSSHQSSSSLPVISRQRVLLILDGAPSVDWPQQFVNYHRLIAGLSPANSGTQSALSNFLSSATAQLTSSVISGTSSASADGTVLVEQADFRDISVLANQSSSTAIVLVNSPAARTIASQSSMHHGRQTSPNARNQIGLGGAKVIRPEYVVIRQRSKGDYAASDHLRGIVTAFNYCLVPMFEPFEIWNTFQDKQLIFAKLLRVQKELGKENFPLIPQVYCQTYQDLLNHINSSTVTLPCLVRTGQLGKGKMRADSLQMLKDFASIVATSGLSCTVEPYLDVKCDLILQKLGTSYKLFKRVNVQNEMGNTQFVSKTLDGTLDGNTQSVSRQTSLGSSVLSSLIPNSSQQQQQQQINRRNSNPGLAFEKLTELVNVRYKNWLDAVIREFDNKLDAFSLKILVTNQDREYIVGLSDCSMEFLGSQENQEEDRRGFVELIISNMNTVLPKHSLSREQSANLTPSNSVAVSNFIGSTTIRRSSSDDKTTGPIQSTQSSVGLNRVQENTGPLGDKKKFISQTQINGANKGRGSSARAYGQLSSRSQSVSVNQSEYLIDNQPMNRSFYFTRKGSDHSDSMTNDVTDDTTSIRGSSLQMSGATDSSSSHQRQASLGQSFLDQTSTAFSSLQKQSLNFFTNFKRLDTKTGDLAGNTPPMSAKSDKGFDRVFATALNSSSPVESSEILTGGIKRNDFKSQSVDCSGLASSDNGPSFGARPDTRGHRRETPPKPPPPQSLGSRQSSLASYSTQRVPSNVTTPNSTPTHSHRNITQSDRVSNDSTDANNKSRFIRQNSALSAFEPFDPDVRTHLSRESLDRETSGFVGHSTVAASQSAMNNSQTNKPLDSVIRRGNHFDSASVTSGDSNSTSETTTAEDTMNNLEKTFASILFGDKCD